MVDADSATTRRNVGILIFDDIEVLDFAGPFEVFSRTRLQPGAESRRSEESAPFRVFTVARTRQPVTATGGLTVLPRHAFDDAPRIDLLLVPGGWGTRALLADQSTLDWIRRTAATAERVASVCTGALLLGAAGLLRGRRATTHHAALDAFAALGTGATVERNVRFIDDGVVTSAGVAAGIDMAFHLVESLHGRAVAEETAHYIEYAPRREPAGSSPGT
jgi:transcriptional regulator GlxA family with amidase domain